MENNISYQHYPLDLAHRDFEASRGKRFKVTTINWTFAGQDDGKIDYFQVHKNEYDMTLEELINWIRDTEEVAEDIIGVEMIL